MFLPCAAPAKVPATAYAGERAVCFRKRFVGKNCSGSGKKRSCCRFIRGAAHSAGVERGDFEEVGVFIGQASYSISGGCNSGNNWSYTFTARGCSLVDVVGGGSRRGRPIEPRLPVSTGGRQKGWSGRNRFPCTGPRPTEGNLEDVHRSGRHGEGITFGDAGQRLAADGDIHGAVVGLARVSGKRIELGCPGGRRGKVERDRRLVVEVAGDHDDIGLIDDICVGKCINGDQRNSLPVGDDRIGISGNVVCNRQNHRPGAVVIAHLQRFPHRMRTEAVGEVGMRGIRPGAQSILEEVLRAEAVERGIEVYIDCPDSGCQCCVPGMSRRVGSRAFFIRREAVIQADSGIGLLLSGDGVNDRAVADWNLHQIRLEICVPGKSCVALCVKRGIDDRYLGCSSSGIRAEGWDQIEAIRDEPDLAGVEVALACDGLAEDEVRPLAVCSVGRHLLRSPLLIADFEIDRAEIRGVWSGMTGGALGCITRSSRSGQIVNQFTPLGWRQSHIDNHPGICADGLHVGQRIGQMFQLSGQLIFVADAGSVARLDLRCQPAIKTEIGIVLGGVAEVTPDAHRSRMIAFPGLQCLRANGVRRPCGIVKLQVINPQRTGCAEVEVSAGLNGVCGQAWHRGECPGKVLPGAGDAGKCMRDADSADGERNTAAADAGLLEPYIHFIGVTGLELLVGWPDKGILHILPDAVGLGICIGDL